MSITKYRVVEEPVMLVINIMYFLFFTTNFYTDTGS